MMDLDRNIEKKRLIIVDDELFNIQALEGMLKILNIKKQINVDICYNGQQSVDLIQKSIDEGDVDRYSLILTDISMPHLDGFEASKITRELRR
jgi:CheY-like chemotaxis protein